MAILGNQFFVPRGHYHQERVDHGQLGRKSVMQTKRVIRLLVCWHICPGRINKPSLLLIVARCSWSPISKQQTECKQTYQLVFLSLYRETENPKLVYCGPCWTRAVMGSRLNEATCCTTSSSDDRTAIRVNGDIMVNECGCVGTRRKEWHLLLSLSC